ncbi:MAG: translation initiation factor IF-2 associated domain-containing protein, partial [Proteobacteria bacterium]|nr:translation initiation factor IF-2 associated domain-containing protein [Pseudomonadota bacterium]
MAEVTVRQFADKLEIPIERLLTQLGQAGLPVKIADDKIDETEKNQLLTYLRHIHGKDDVEQEVSTTPKKITLKRKTTSELKVSNPTGRTKTVHVEVRKKRTYIKRGSKQSEPKEEVVGSPNNDNPEETITESAPKEVSKDSKTVTKTSTPVTSDKKVAKKPVFKKKSSVKSNTTNFKKIEKPVGNTIKVKAKKRPPPPSDKIVDAGVVKIKTKKRQPVEPKPEPNVTNKRPVSKKVVAEKPKTIPPKPKEERQSVKTDKKRASDT